MSERGKAAAVITAYNRNGYGCPDIASVRSLLAAYPATICFHSICELALSLRQHKLAKPRRWPQAHSSAPAGSQAVHDALSSECLTNRGIHVLGAD
jgi:hypothetical protein